MSVRFITLPLATLCAFVSMAAHATTWEYLSYPDGQDVNRPPNMSLYPGSITLDESGPTPVFEMMAGKVTMCFSGKIDAQVERTAETTLITVRRDLKGCGSARFVIRNDGSGGRREILRGGKWVWDGLERGLTLKTP